MSSAPPEVDPGPPVGEESGPPQPPAGPNTTRLVLLRSERAAMVLGLLAVGLSTISLDPKMVAGVFLGAAIGWGNLLAVRSLYERVAWGSAAPKAIRAAFMVKMVLLLTLVTVVVLVLKVSGLGFIIGFSTAILAVMVVPLMAAVFKQPGETNKAGGSGPDSGRE